MEVTSNLMDASGAVVRWLGVVGRPDPTLRFGDLPAEPHNQAVT